MVASEESEAGLQRSTRGCTSCRRRKKKCNEQHPVCAGCLRNDLQCEWPGDKIVRKPRGRRKDHRLNKDFAVPASIQPMTFVFSAPNKDTVWRLMSHFERSSPVWFTVWTQRKHSSYLGQVMPAALRNPVILHCIMALAAADLSKTATTDVDLMGLSYDHYGQALQGIQSDLQSKVDHLNDPYPDDTLLAVLLLSVHEAQNFTQNERIIPHLNAAATLCHQRLNSTNNTPDMRGMLFELFCYQITLVGSSHGGSLNLPLAQHVFDSSFLSGHACEGILLGTSRKVFWFIFRISVITRNQNPLHLDPISRFELEVIELQLSNLKFQFGGATDGNDEDVPDHTRTSEIYRLASLLHVKMILDPHLSIRTPTVQKIVTEFIYHLERLSESSPSNNILVWPLVVAGLSAVSTNHRKLIARRLKTNYQIYRSEIMRLNARFLNEVWKQEKEKEDMNMNHESPSSLVYEPVVLSGAKGLYTQIPAILL